jgi:hypothetical protein
VQVSFCRTFFERLLRKYASVTVMRNVPASWLETEGDHLSEKASWAASRLPAENQEGPYQQIFARPW